MTVFSCQRKFLLIDFSSSTILHIRTPNALERFKTKPKDRMEKKKVTRKLITKFGVCIRC